MTIAKHIPLARAKYINQMENVIQKSFQFKLQKALQAKINRHSSIDRCAIDRFNSLVSESKIKSSLTDQPRTLVS
jgi:hypothetical protein